MSFSKGTVLNFVIFPVSISILFHKAVFLSLKVSIPMPAFSSKSKPLKELSRCLTLLALEV